MARAGHSTRQKLEAFYSAVQPEKISKIDRPFSRQIFWTGIADAPAGKHPDDIGKAHIAVTIQVGWTGHRHTGRITRIAARQPLVVVQDAVAIAVHHQSNRMPGRGHGDHRRGALRSIQQLRNGHGLARAIKQNGFARKHPTAGSAIDFNRGHQLNPFRVGGRR